MESLLMNLLGGAVGGNVAGGLLKKFSLGTIGNSLVGILGGGLGGQLLSALGAPVGDTGSAMDMGSVISNVLSSGAGGGVLLAIVGFLKSQFMSK